MRHDGTCRRSRNGGGGVTVAIGARAGRADRRCRRGKLDRAAARLSAGWRSGHCGRTRAIRAGSFAAAELEELTASLRERGIIQPIVVRPLRGVPDGYEIIAGERRWRAAQRAGLHEVPVVVIEATDAEALQLAIIENVQRADLNPLEEAEGYRALMDEFHNSQEEIAKIVGKSRSYIANTLRLLKLPDAVKGYIQDGKLTAGHARMLIGEAECRRACGRHRRARSQCARSGSRWRASARKEREETNRRQARPRRI